MTVTDFRPLIPHHDVYGFCTMNNDLSADMGPLIQIQ